MDHSSPAQITLIDASTDSEVARARDLMLTYAHSLSVSLDFQGFDQEMSQLPGPYAAPDGALVIATVNGIDAGCCALRPIADVDYSNACEMKRLFVLPAFRGFGLGRLLVERVMSVARAAGYAHMLLDTLDEMEAARALYRELGFEEVDAYYYNPLPGTRYLAASL